MSTKFDPNTGGIIFTPQEKDNEVIIKKVGDFPTTIDPLKVYFIDKPIDLGTREFEFNKMYLSGHGYGISSLYSNEPNHTMFKKPIGAPNEDFISNGVALYSTGAGSKLFDVDNEGGNAAFEMNSTNLGDFGPNITPSLGTIKGYRQIRTSDFAAINFQEGLTIDGAISGIAPNDAILLQNIAGTTFLKAGPTLQISGGMSSDMNGLPMSPTSIWTDIAPSNFTGNAVMALSRFRTSANNALPNMPETSIRSYFKNCVGIDDTSVGAAWVMNTELPTVLITSGTPQKLNGVTTATLGAHFSAPVSNRLQYDGLRQISVDVLGQSSLSTGGDEALTVHIRKWDAAALSFSPLATYPIETQLKISGERRGQSGIVTFTTMKTGDYIEQWVSNDQNIAAPTGKLGTTLTVRERS